MFATIHTIREEATPEPAPGDSLLQDTKAVLVASRALVAVAARSLATVEDSITLPQYRALVILASRGPQNVGMLADLLHVHPSTATRLCDRMAAKGLIERSPSTESRREVTVNLAPAGEALLRTVTDHRLQDLSAIIGRLDSGTRRSVAEALLTFAEAASEVPDDLWSVAWTQ